VNISRAHVPLATDELDGTDLVGKWVLIACGTYTVKSSVVDKVLNQTARVDIQGIQGYNAIKMEF